MTEIGEVMQRFESKLYQQVLRSCLVFFANYIVNIISQNIQAKKVDWVASLSKTIVNPFHLSAFFKSLLS